MFKKDHRVIQSKWHFKTLYETKKEEVQYNAILFMKHVSHNEKENENLEQKFYICLKKK